VQCFRGKKCNRDADKYLQYKLLGDSFSGYFQGFLEYVFNNLTYGMLYQTDYLQIIFSGTTYENYND